jgi:rhamnosyltransferase
VNRVAGCVVLFNPANDAPTLIGTYQTQVDRLWVVDNSTRPNTPVVAALNQFPNVVYVDNGGNRGIAHALNRAAEAAEAEGFAWLLTMDQDTALPPDGVARLLAFANEQTAPIGIVAGQTGHIATHQPPATPWVPFVITSGNLLRLSAWRVVGGFLEPLFIDWVDHEFCLRLGAAGYGIAELPGVRLRHRLGQAKSVRLAGRVLLAWVWHGPERGYYKVRNILFVSRLHCPILTPGLRWLYRKEIAKVLVKTLFLYDQKIRRLRLLIRAVADARAGRLGPVATGLAQVVNQSLRHPHR